MIGTDATEIKLQAETIAATRPHGKRRRESLATNPFPIVIPCHRAIRSDGSLGGYQGGLTMKRELLEREGIAFRGAERVAPAVFFYSRSNG